MYVSYSKSKTIRALNMSLDPVVSTSLETFLLFLLLHGVKASPAATSPATFPIVGRAESWNVYAKETYATRNSGSRPKGPSPLFIHQETL